MKHLSFTFFLIFSILIVGCRDESITQQEDEENEPVIDPTETYEDWTANTHGNEVDPDYTVVFPQDEVLRFDITIDPDDWSDMQSDLSDILQNNSGNTRPGEIASDSYDTPMWIPCSFNFNDTEWYKVGIRYKGNSSLNASSSKLSLKLDFDEFEDDYPEMKNQRFYGFKQLNLNSNYNDPSFLREKVVADLFRDFGIPAPLTSYCVIYIDYGSGSKYYGVYTIVEEVDDTVLNSQFADGSGNLYKPEDDAATFASGTYDEDEYYKKTNEEEGDFSDVKNLYDVINSSTRTSDSETWQTELEAVLDVDQFLKWLAANTVIQNWDTYGNMSHNYYLYNNTGKLQWIPWDNNEALDEGKALGALPLSLSSVSSSWPLIKYIVEVDEYMDIYEGYLAQFCDEVFTVEATSARYQKYSELIQSYVYEESYPYSHLNSSYEFDAEVNTLYLHVQERNDDVEDYLQ